MADKASTRLFAVSLRSSDRDELIYPTASHYALEFPAIDNVVGVQVASIELPEYDTHYTIQTDFNDKFTFSEGLRVDFNTLVEDVDQISGLDLYPNQICIREGSNNFIVSVPAYLTEVTSFSSNNLVTPDLACDAGWRKCWLDWQASNPTAPSLSVVCSTAGYVGQLVANSLGTKLSITADEAKFRYGYVHLPPVSTNELCAYLTYAFQNYTTYASTPSSRPSNSYAFAYKYGRLCVEFANTTTASMHFVTTANASQTAWYGSQNNGFATRMVLNNPTPGITSLAYMLGFSSSSRQYSQLRVMRRQAELTVSGFVADQQPRFLFEARLSQGVYSPADLVVQLPIAMNPLNFVQASSSTTTTTTTTTTAMGAGYFGFRDSAGRESLIVVNSGRYTPETFCQAIEYALNRQDTNGPYYSTNRFSYGAVMLNFNDSQAWPSITKPSVVYSVVYSYSTNKFTIMSALATSTKPFDPSTATVLSSKAGQVFGLLFDPASIATIAAQIPDLSSMCANANLDRMARTFGMVMRDYTSSNSYTSQNQVHIPRIIFPLSVMVDIFRYDDPSEMGLGGSSTAVGAGTPVYLFPTGTYAVTGATPPVRSINLSSQCQPSMVSTSTNYSTTDITAPTLTMANRAFLASDYSINTAGANIAPGTYMAMDVSDSGDTSASSTIIQVNTVTYDKTAGIATFTVIDTGVGTISLNRTNKPFNGIYSDDMLRMMTISNVSSNEPHMLISQHANQVSSTNKAYVTTKPFGFQVSDIVSTRCISTALVMGSQVARTLTAPIWLGPNRGLLVGQTYTLTSTGALVAGQFYLVNGGGRNAVVQATTANVVVVVEPGSGFFPTVGATTSQYTVRGPIMYHAWQGVVVQQANSGAHFTDSTNVQREQFMSCLPYLSQSLSCTAAKTVDGACMRLRVPSGFVQYASPSPDYLSANLNFVSEFYQARLDVHIEDLATSKAGHAGTILGIGKANLAMSSTISMPHAINLDAVPYVMVKFVGLNNQRSNQIHWTDSRMLGDLVTKVVLGAPTSVVRGLLSSVEFAKQRIARLELAFYMPDGQTLYDFHGLEHSLTLNFMIRDPVAKRKISEI